MEGQALTQLFIGVLGPRRGEWTKGREQGEWRGTGPGWEQYGWVQAFFLR